MRRPKLLRRGIVALVKQQVKRPQNQGPVLFLSRLSHANLLCAIREKGHLKSWRALELSVKTCPSEKPGLSKADALTATTRTVRLSVNPALEFRSTVDRDTGSRDPSRPIGRQKSNYVGDILGLADSLQCLHSQGDLASRFCLRKIRHIRVDYAWCDSVYAYAARPENGGPVLDQSLKCSLGRGVSQNRRVFQTGLPH